MATIVNRTASLLRAVIMSEKVKTEFNKMMTAIYAVMIFVTLSYTPAMPIIVAVAAELGTIAGVVYFAERSLHDEKEKIK